MTSVRQISSGMLVETINGFNELTIQSTINDSKEDTAESNPKVANYTTNGKSPHKSILNRLIQRIIPYAILPIDQMITVDVAGIRETLDTRQTVLLKDIVTEAFGLLGR